MRLWHEALIPYLPHKQLCGLHCEVCALRGKGWEKKHKTVNYVFEHPYGWLVAYHWRVMKEMERRGYSPQKEWYKPWYRGKNLPEIKYGTKEATDLYMDVATGINKRHYVYPEHNDAYLKECLENLEGKGIHIEMEE